MKLKRAFLFGFLAFLGYLFLYMPHSLKMAVARGLAVFASLIDKRAKHIKANLKFCSFEMPPQEQKELIKACYFRIIYNSITFFELGVMSEEKLKKRVIYDGSENVEKLLAQNRKIVFFTAHFGAWEYLTPAFALGFCHSIAAFARLSKYPLVNEYLQKTRQRFNTIIIDKNKGLAKGIKALKDIGVIGIVSDQNVSLNEGVIVKFCNQNCCVSPVVSLLALKYNAAIVPAFARYSSDFRQVIFEAQEPILPPKSGELSENILALTQKQSDILENQVRKYPQEWLWFHRKFKNTHSEIYEN